MNIFETTKREYMDKCAEREGMVKSLEDYRREGNTEAFDDMKIKIGNINADIDRLKFSMDEQQRKMDTYEPSAAEARDMAEERGSQLMRGEGITFTAQELRRGIRNIARVDNSITLASGSLALPTGAGSTIHDPIGNNVSALIDQVYVQDMTGMGSFLEPYVKTELDAKGGKVTTNAGKARTDSADPTFATAKIAPYELSVTAYVDRGISRLSPAAYFEKVYGMALRAMRRKTCECIISGDGQASPDMFGITNAKNTDGENIFASIASLPMDASILDELFFAYGGDTVLGMGARVILTKSQLKALGKLRNSNMERVFKIRPDAGNHNTGMIDDGGTLHPYTLVSGDGTKIMYGDPMNYELALFGGFTVRVDESIKGVERMFTILGDAMVGGNLIADKGMVVGTIAQG